MKLLPLLLLLFSCQNLQYTSDMAFLNSAQANSPEYLVKIDGVVCKDMENTVGLCAKRIKSGNGVSFKMDKQPYAYRLNVECSSTIGFSLSRDILPNVEHEFSIDAEKLSNVTSFTCFGEVFPQDRSSQVSAFWHVRFLIVDKNYRPREEIYQFGNKLILGQHAKYILVNDKVKFKKKTNIKFKGVNRVHSESDQMRLNYYGY